MTFADSILLEPWVITPEGYRGFAAGLLEKGASTLMARPADPVDGTSCVEMRAEYPEVAIVHVKGTLVRYGSWSRGTSYGELRKDLQRVLDNDDVKAILWNIDSPGGEVNGCAELADAIYAARAKKTMAVYAAGTCASGALWLASAAGGGAIACAPTALLGSIGVITWLYDDSKMMDEVGIKEFEIVASQSPRKSQNAGDAGYRARVQQRLDDLCDVFQAAVARNYGVSLATVQKKFGQGDVFVAARAMDVGLAAEISDFESVLAATAARVRAVPASNPFTSGVTVEGKMIAKLLKLPEAATEREIEDRAQALSQFERGVLAATESKTPEEAIGKVTAGAQAIVENGKLREKVEAQADEACRREFRSEVKAALKEGRLTLGELPIITSFLKDEERAKADAALAGVKSQEKKELLDALCTASISPKRLTSVKAFLGKKPKVDLPKPKAEHADDEQGRKDAAEKVGADLASSETKKAAAAYGLRPEALAFATVTDVAELEQKLEKKGA